MTTITITKEVSKEKGLVVITRKQYQRFLKLEKAAADPILLAAQKADQDFRAGRISGPFKTAAELVKHLHKVAR